AMKGYACEANFERLRRGEQLAKEKGCTVPQIAMAWIYQQPVQTFAVVSTSKPKRMQENVDALNIELTPKELAWLDLRK
ncbi:MAG: aldo/keto reductase, partial [Clostridiales bacterium]|nr:aldo/keto reductase [Clostridiales bacterium]